MKKRMVELNLCPYCNKDLDAHVIGNTNYGCPRDEAAAGRLLYFLLIFSWIVLIIVLLNK